MEVCPYAVFEVGTIEDDEYRRMPFFVRVKILLHRKQTALSPRVDACRACGLCVVACPEKAITLVRSAGS